jgi:uncharacterized protein YdaU (DUF1376 family)
MTLEERGAYITLLCDAWTDRGIEPDTQSIADRLCVDIADAERLMRGTLGRCFEEVDGRLVNPRQERERERVEELSQKRARAGSAGNRQSRANARQEGACAGPIEPESEPEPEREFEIECEPEPERIATGTPLWRAVRKQLEPLTEPVLVAARKWDDHAREKGWPLSEQAWRTQLAKAAKDPTTWVAYVEENLGANANRLQDPPKRAGGGQPYTKLTAREASAERHVAAWDEFINHLNTKDPQCLTPAPSAMLSAGSKTSPTPPLSPPTLPPGKNGSPGSTPR